MQTGNVETICPVWADGAETLAIIIRGGTSYPMGAHFVTGDKDPLQVGTIRYPAGHTIKPHIHGPRQSEISKTWEVLHLRRGRIMVDFYLSDGTHATTRVLYVGDTLLLIGGGHAFRFLEESELIEVKQGPYLGASDKTFFNRPPMPKYDPFLQEMTSKVREIRENIEGINKALRKE